MLHLSTLKHGLLTPALEERLAASPALSTWKILARKYSVNRTLFRELTNIVPVVSCRRDLKLCANISLSSALLVRHSNKKRQIFCLRNPLDSQLSLWLPIRIVRYPTLRTTTTRTRDVDCWQIVCPRELRKLQLPQLMPLSRRQWNAGWWRPHPPRL